MSWTVSRRNEESAGCGFLVQRRRGVVGTFHLDFFRGKNKKEYGVVGKLSEQSYNGRKFVGFKRLGFADN